MKKFLTMLLALSVVFTYTFGTAGSVFAAASYYDVGANFSTIEKAEAAYLADIDDAEKVVLTALKSNYDIAVIKVTQRGDAATTVSGATNAEIPAKYWLEQLETEYTDVRTAVLNETRRLKSANYAAADTAKITAGAYSSITKDDVALMNGVYSTEKYAFGALKAAFDDYKIDSVAKINSVNTSIYSSTDYTATTKPSGSYLWAYPTGATTTKTVYNAKTVADETLKYAISLVNAVTLDATVIDTTDITAKYDDVDTAVTTYTTAGFAADGKTYAYTFKAQGSSSLLPYTKAAETTAGANKNANIAKAKADLENKVAIAIAGVESLSAAERALWDTVKDAYIEVETALIDGSVATVNSFPASVSYNTAVTEVNGNSDALAYLAKVALVDKYESKAVALKAEKNTDGTIAYDADVIDELLADLVAGVYDGTITGNPANSDFADAKLDTVSDYRKNELKATVDNLVDSDDLTHNISVNSTYTTVTAGASPVPYYAKEFVAVTDAVKEYKAAVDVAKTNADIVAANKALKKALETTIPQSQVVYDAATSKAVDDAEEMAAAYVATLNAGKIAADKVPAAPADLTSWFKTNGARTAADVVALYDTLKAELAGKLSDNAMKAEVKALQDQIDALPASLTITAADSDKVLACKDAFDAFAELYITSSNINANNTLNAPYAAYSINATALGKAYSAVLSIKEKEIVDAAKAIAKADASAVTVADKAAVNNLVVLQEAYKEITGAYCNSAVTTAMNADTWVVTALTTIRDIEAKAVVAAVVALPTEIKLEDKAAVEAARKAYDAFVAEYNLYDTNNIYGSAYDAIATLATAPYNFNLGKLEAAEASIALAEDAAKWTDKDVKAAMYDAAKTTSYTKPSKTSVKLTAKADMTEIKENGYTVKYRFYQKGPKKTSYKLWKTSTSSAYTFKGLKAGTHSFKVKVSVYNAEGKLVAYKYTNVRTLKIK